MGCGRVVRRVCVWGGGGARIWGHAQRGLRAGGAQSGCVCAWGGGARDLGACAAWAAGGVVRGCEGKRDSCVCLQGSLMIKGWRRKTALGRGAAACAKRGVRVGRGVRVLGGKGG